MVFALMLDRFTRHNNLCKKSVPRSRSIHNLFLADLISSRCHDKTNSIPVGSAPYPFALTKQQCEINVQRIIVRLDLLAKQKVSFVSHLTIDAAWKTVRELFCIRYFSKNEEQTSQKIYRVMCFYSIENNMQNFRHFCKKKKNTQHDFALRTSITRICEFTET